jgi:hypothetical protein
MGVEEADRSISNYVMCVQELYFDSPFKLRYHS